MDGRFPMGEVFLCLYKYGDIRGLMGRRREKRSKRLLPPSAMLCSAQGHLTHKKPPPCRGTSLITNSASLEFNSRAMPRALWWSKGGGLFRVSEVHLYDVRTLQ